MRAVAKNIHFANGQRVFNFFVHNLNLYDSHRCGLKIRGLHSKSNKSFGIEYTGWDRMDFSGLQSTSGVNW